MLEEEETAMLTPRPRDEVAAQYTYATTKLSALAGSVRIETATQLSLAGVREALAWVLGQTTVAPVTGRTLPDPGPRELFSEWSAAEAIASRTWRRPVGMALEYAGGVEHALDWARGHPLAAAPAL